ncbi:hypothetical protein EHYA_08796 [Embleya hyalina]|uniref:Alpha-amylase n=1 Tax=Embleya hyalina TaxID=516124 RepID=A0A401Z2G7_9ACTN|nr:hypothetical protein EHYA_08796 [Embleya hyalina]
MSALSTAVVLGITAAAPAQAAETSTRAARPCAVSFAHHGPLTDVYYRHCTSGSDWVKVKAIIKWGGDGPCYPVGPGQTRLIASFVQPERFDRIVRC